MKALLAVIAMLTLLLVSSLVLIECKHQVRVLFAQVEMLKSTNWTLMIRREALLLEQSRLSALPIIDKVARNDLRMISPDPIQDVTYYQQ